MKTTLLILSLFISSFVFAQTDTSKTGHVITKMNVDGDDVFTIVEQMPQFPGGQKKMMKYIQKNIKYPSETHDSGGGTVYVHFVVERDGSRTNMILLRGTKNCESCDAEAKRVVESMPPWEPGKQNGKVVRVAYNLPIKFVP